MHTASSYFFHYVEVEHHSFVCTTYSSCVCKLETAISTRAQTRTPRRSCGCPSHTSGGLLSGDLPAAVKLTWLVSEACEQHDLSQAETNHGIHDTHSCRRPRLRERLPSILVGAWPVRWRIWWSTAVGSAPGVGKEVAEPHEHASAAPSTACTPLDPAEL